MLTRRSLISGMTGGMAAAAADSGAAEAGGPEPEGLQSGDEQVARVLEQIRDELRLHRGTCSPASCTEVDAIRSQQRTFLRGRGKFPDFIDVGIEVWERLYDWHVRAGLKPEISRTSDGRYAMAFMLTLLVLRPEMTPNHIGLGYDERG